jgi:cyclophilin family peptidyl-prolyl cis-trans isomerase
MMWTSDSRSPAADDEPRATDLRFRGKADLGRWAGRNVFQRPALVELGKYVLSCVEFMASSSTQYVGYHMVCKSRWFWCVGVLSGAVLLGTVAQAAEKPAAAASPAAQQAKADFDAKFEAYKAAVREIEKVQAEYQTADDATRKKLNEAMTGQIAHTQSLVNAMVQAAEDAYRAAPNADQQVTNVLVAVAKHYVVGRQIGAGEPSQSDPSDVYYPTDGGDQYERGLPIVKMLIDGGAQDNELYVWGFLCAYMTNDYDLAKMYLTKAKETGAIDAITMMASRSDRDDPQAGLNKNLERLVSTCAENLDEYRELWKKESEIRAAEAKADDLPRVKLTTTKGEIVVELFENEAPQTVANFLTLVKQGFYNGSPFHRVLPMFMAQGGAKTDDGQGGPGYTIRDELPPNFRRHFRGTLSMAKTVAPDSGNSQFFLTFVPTAHLNGHHTAFGRVIEGMEVLGDLQHRSTMHEKNPPKADRIIKAEVLRDRGHEYKFEKLSGP